MDHVTLVPVLQYDFLSLSQYLQKHPILGDQPPKQGAFYYCEIPTFTNFESNSPLTFKVTWTWHIRHSCALVMQVCPGWSGDACSKHRRSQPCSPRVVHLVNSFDGKCYAFLFFFLSLGFVSIQWFLPGHGVHLKKGNTGQAAMAWTWEGIVLS